MSKVSSNPPNRIDEKALSPLRKRGNNDEHRRWISLQPLRFSPESEMDDGRPPADLNFPLSAAAGTLPDRGHQFFFGHCSLCGNTGRCAADEGSDEGGEHRYMQLATCTGP